MDLDMEGSICRQIHHRVRSYLPSVVSLLLTTINLRSGVSYYLIVTTVFVASVIAMTDERVRLKVSRHHQWS
jgi:hypothetical protein